MTLTSNFWHCINAVSNGINDDLTLPRNKNSFCPLVLIIMHALYLFPCVTFLLSSIFVMLNFL